MFKVFLDDSRIAPLGWITIRTAEALLDFMKWNVGKISELSLDHDLNDKSADEKHGYWFVKQMVDAWLYADIIYFHTANQIGKENMYHYLKNAQEHGALPKHVILHSIVVPNGFREGEWKDESDAGSA